MSYVLTVLTWTLSVLFVCHLTNILTFLVSTRSALRRVDYQSSPYARSLASESTHLKLDSVDKC